MRTPFLSLAALAVSTAATPAFAEQDIGGGFSLSGNAALVTDYRFRGVSFSGEDIAIQGGIDLAHMSGFYLGTWGSSLEEETGVFEDNGDTIGLGHTEIDIYAGWRGELRSGVEVDVGMLYYYYPNANNNIVVAGTRADFPTDYFEPYAAISYSIGPAQLTTGFAYAFDQDALGNNDNLYVYGELGIGIPNTPLTVNGHLGYTNGSLSVDTDNDYLDWSIGVDYVLGPATIGVAYIDTNAPSIAGLDATLVGTFAISF